MTARIENLIEEINDMSPDEREELLAAFPVVHENLEPTKTIDLDEPIKFGSREEFSAVHLKAPNGQQVLNAMRKADAATGLTASLIMQQELIAANSGLTQREVELLPFTVIMEAFQYLEGFMKPGRRTAKK